MIAGGKQRAAPGLGSHNNSSFIIGAGGRGGVIHHSSSIMRVLDVVEVLGVLDFPALLALIPGGFATGAFAGLDYPLAVPAQRCHRGAARPLRPR